ncbi:MAG: metallophosphoesterase family protein [Minisyncoccales bacterium]
MPRFAHMSDLHLGSWKEQPMQLLNFKSFQKAIAKCLESKIDFVVISGDIFDTAYPSIEVLKEAFSEFKKLKEAGINCYLIAGSHDYSVSGKTFLDVLENAGLCKNVSDFEYIGENCEKILLNPIIKQGVAFYGYPGKKSGMEINDLRKIRLNDAPGMFKIFLLHTTIDKAKGNIPVDSISSEELPKADYYALGHIHTDFQYGNIVYPGPIFPNNFQELEDLQQGSFYIVDTSKSNNPLEKVELRIKDIVRFDIEITNALTATEKIISEIEKKDIKDKLVLLRIRGELEKGKNADIDYNKITEKIIEKKAYFMLRNTHELKTKELEMDSEIKETDDAEYIEEETIKNYSKKNPSDFNHVIPQLMNVLSTDQREGETKENFKNRISEEAKKIWSFNMKNETKKNYFGKYKKL